MIKPQDIAEPVRELRLRLSLTQEEFVAKLGVTFPNAIVGKIVALNRPA